MSGEDDDNGDMSSDELSARWGDEYTRMAINPGDVLRASDLAEAVHDGDTDRVSEVCAAGAAGDADRPDIYAVGSSNGTCHLA